MPKFDLGSVHRARTSRGSWLRSICVLWTCAACGGSQALPVAPPMVESTAAPVAAPPDVEPPNGKLPEQVTPLRYRLELMIVPDRERFAGVAEIDLRVTQPSARIFLHAQAMNVAEVSLRSAAGRSFTTTFRTFGDTGVVALEFAEPIQPGDYIARFSYDAPFDHQLRGLYRVDAGGQAYAFTQFEAISARLAFPCFDEPRFKTPFEVTLTVRADDKAIANTRETSGELLADGLRRVRFAPTEPLPTYLVAFAVGPLDIVEAAPLPPNDTRAQPIPFRAIAVKGKGAELAYAIEHTPPMVAALERYFGIAYPYDKLDILAVPDFAAGAMENAGAITFREQLLLLAPDKATESQRRGFSYVMAHELAHQWFGNLVTMPWWDDIWLNEAFATWMGHRVVEEVHPEQLAGVSLLQSVHNAMAQDSLASARVIRQPIESNHDILNAFDSITYSKGGGVLAMFERYLGAETFASGIHAYLEQHRFGTATSADLIASLGAAAQRDLTPAFDSFLTQTGVPLVSAQLSCTAGQAPRIALEQARYRPLGADRGAAENAAEDTAPPRVWQIPICVRWGAHKQVEQTCTLLTEASGSLELPGTTCPDWFMPNADAGGYLRFHLPAEDLQRLLKRGFANLNVREQVAVVDSLSAGFSAGTLDANVLFTAAKALVVSQERSVVTAPMAWLNYAREHLVAPEQRARVDAFGRSLYQQHKKRLGWKAAADEAGERRLLRTQVLSFLALDARDAATRREAIQRGLAYLGVGGDEQIHTDAVDPDLLGIVLAVALQDGDAALFDRLLALFYATEDAVLRDRLLSALGSTRDAELARRALQLALDAKLRVNEALTPLSHQLDDPEQRDAAWQWLVDNFDGVVARVGPMRAGRLPWLGARYCAVDKQAQVRTLFVPRLEALGGGPRNLNGALEAIGLCAAKAETQRPSAEAFFEKLR